MEKKICEVVDEDSKYVKLKVEEFVGDFASSGHKFEKRHPGVYRAIAVTIFGTPYYF